MESTFFLNRVGCPCCAYAAVTSSSPFSRLTHYVRSYRPASAATLHRSDDFSPGHLCIDNAKIIDPRDGSVGSDMSVLIKDGRIVDVLPTATRGLDSSAQRIDAVGRFVVPGYNDMHSHAFECADPTRPLALMLAEGVTGFRQMSGSPQLLERRRSRTLPLGREAPALLETSGSILTPMNAGTIEAAIAEIRRQKAQGADFIKVIFLNPDVFFAAIAEAKRLGISIVGHLQEGTGSIAASMAGLRSIEHLGPGSAIWVDCSTEAVALHADAARRPVLKAPPIKVPFVKQIVAAKFRQIVINPLVFVNPSDVARLRRAIDTFSEDKAHEVAARFVADNTWQVPTLVRLRAMELADDPDYERDPMLHYMTPKSIKAWRRINQRFKSLPSEMRDTYRLAYPRQLALAKVFADAGVRMMTGSDGGSLFGPGLTLQREFSELARAGISPLKILQMTTINVADYLGRSDTMGTVDIGRDANLVILDANPLESVDNLSKIAGVVRGGVHYSRQEIVALKDRVVEKMGRLH
jgi:imidazolonepropionase-like amidohydrolase